MLSSAVFPMLMKKFWDGFRKHMNSATENSTTFTCTETRTGLGQGLLMKVFFKARDGNTSYDSVQIDFVL